MNIINDRAKAQALNQELSALLDKGAIEPVDPLLHPGGFHMLTTAGGSTYNCQRRVVYVSRPEGCLLPHPYSSTPSADFAVCLSRVSFPVPSAPIRSLPLPSGVHQVCDGSPLTLAVAGHEDSPISGRLAHLCAIPVSAGTGHIVSSLSCGPPGPQGEFYKELPGSISGHVFSWDDS